MAKNSKKYNKAPKPIYVPKEARYLRGITLAVIYFLTMFMPKTLAIRLVSLLFIAEGMHNERIAMLVGCNVKTVRTLRARMDTEEVCEILTIKPGSGRKPKASTSKANDIVGMVMKGKFSTLLQIAIAAKRKFKLALSKSTISRLLKKFNIRKLKCGSLPSKADPVAQRSFYDKILHPLMKKAKETADCVVLFLDGSHFVMGDDFRGAFYCLYRRFVKTGSGRKRYNVLGALNFVTKVVHTVPMTSILPLSRSAGCWSRLPRPIQGKKSTLSLIMLRTNDASLFRIWLRS